MALSNEDREALHRMLGCCVDCPTNHGYDLSQLDEVAAWVEARIAEARAAALNEAADRLPALTEGEDRHGTATWRPHDRDVYSLAIEEAQAAISNLATPP